MYFLYKLKHSAWKLYIFALHLLLSLSCIMFISVIPVYASNTPVTDNLKALGTVIEDFKQANQYTWTQINEFMDTMSRVVGMPKKGHSSGGHAFDPGIVKHIDPDVDEEDPNSIGNWISNQITVQDNDNITVTNNFREMFNDINDSQKRNYCYSFAVRDIAKFFPTTEPYDALLSEISPLKNNTGIWMYQYVNNNHFVYYLDLSHDPNLVWKAIGTVYPTGDLVSAKPYGANGLLNQVDSIIKWDNTNKEWITHSNSALNTSVNNYMSWSPHGTTVQSQTCYWFNINPKQYRWFDKTDTVNAETIKYQDYYYNEEVWTDFSTSSGDYTFDADNINTVTYGDITNYIDSFNTDNGYVPSVQDINIYIEDKNDDDDNGGGGSGGSGSDDDDDDNDSGSIFDWLKNLGKVLGDLIKGVGEFITEIIAGLVSALNDLMSSLSGLITDTLGSLTTVFSSIIDFVYSGLPDSVKGIMMLALTVSLLITVIQLIRK